MPSPVKDKAGKPIEHGDHVWTRIRGGRREGDVEQVATTDQEAKDANIKNPPKVLFEDQHGHNVAHNPETLQHASRN